MEKSPKTQFTGFWKNQHFTRELISRKFLSVICVSHCAQCGNYGNSLSRIFGKNSVKVTVLLKMEKSQAPNFIGSLSFSLYWLGDSYWTE